MNALHRLDRMARNLAPFALVLGLVVIATLPLRLPGYAATAPAVALIAVFYWTVHRPDLLPAPAAFLIGVWQDLLVGTPLGINALLLLAAHRVVSSQRRILIGKPFAVMWWAFAVTAFAAALGLWLLTMAFHAAALGPEPALIQALSTIAVYPFVTWLFAWVQHAVRGPA